MNYNRYSYRGIRIDRKDMTEKKETMEKIESILFSGSKHQKRGQGIQKIGEENRDIIKNKVFETVAQKLGIVIDSIEEKSSFTEDLNADSLDTVELVMQLEDDFKIEIPDEAAQSMRTMKDTIDYVEDQIKKQENATG